MSGIIVFQILIAVTFLALVRASLEVTQVQVLFRHGERTPLPREIYPNDIHNVSEYEPWGLGQLTNLGKVREYKIGLVLKTRYQELLDSLHLHRAVFAVSTDVDRTKMSLQLVLAGLFPPSEAQKWNSELPWMPIPTHYIPEPLDIVLVAHQCPEFHDAVTQAWQLPEVRAKVALHNDLFQFLTVKTGDNITEANRVYDIYNLLVSQKAMNWTLPEWCTDAVLQEMSELTILQYELWSYTKDIKRLNGGHMVREFIKNMHLDKAEENPRKIYLYSAHESTISAFLKAIEITEPKLPLYGTAVMIEKLQDINGKLFVRLILWTGMTEQLITLRLPGCEEICPIERYLHLTREVIPSDEERECHWRRLSDEQIRSAFEEKLSYT